MSRMRKFKHTRKKKVRDLMDHVRKTARQMRKELQPGQSITANLGQREMPENIRAKCTCGGCIDTRLAEMCILDPIDGSRKWIGVPCDGCTNTYTLESSISEVPE